MLCGAESNNELIVAEWTATMQTEDGNAKQGAFVRRDKNARQIFGTLLTQASRRRAEGREENCSLRRSLRQ